MKVLLHAAMKYSSSTTDIFLGPPPITTPKIMGVKNDPCCDVVSVPAALVAETFEVMERDNNKST